MKKECDIQNIKSELISLGDKRLAAFTAKLVPTYPSDKILGIKIPVLAALAKKLGGEYDMDNFYTALPHEWLEEYVLHAKLILLERNFDRAIALTEALLPYADNWLVCDAIDSKAFKPNREKLITHIYKWLASDDQYTKRVAIDLLLRYYLDDEFDEKYLSCALKADGEEYYISMAVAWFFSVALVKQYAVTLAFLRQNRLSEATLSRLKQKCRDSFRLTKEQKSEITSL